MKVKRHKVDYSGWAELSQSEKHQRMIDGTKSHTSEHYVQKKVCSFLRAYYPSIRFYSTLDGFNWGTQRSIMSALRWYNEDHDGTGVPDLFIYKRNRKYTMLVIELKKVGARTKGSAHTNNQQQWLDYFNSIGAKAVFAVGYDEAIDIIKQYMRL